MGKMVCELEGKGDWSARDGYFGSCLNISWETCEEIGGIKKHSDWWQVPICVMDLMSF